MRALDQATLGEIAQRDPRIAFALLNGRSRQPQLFTGRATFDSGDVGKLAPVQFQQIPDNAYAVDFSYDVSTPNANAGNILAGQQQYFNALNPNIDCQVQVTQGYGPATYLVNINYTPLQQIARHTSRAEGSCCSWYQGWYIYKWQALQIQLRLGRAYVAPDELPVVTFGLHIIQLGLPLESISFEMACAELVRAGVPLLQNLQRPGG